MTHEETYKTAATMLRQGSGFAKAIADAWFRADSTNSQRLCEAFPDLFEMYQPKPPRPPALTYGQLHPGQWFYVAREDDQKPRMLTAHASYDSAWAKACIDLTGRCTTFHSLTHVVLIPAPTEKSHG